jgi:hypothetical protein
LAGLTLKAIAAHVFMSEAAASNKMRDLGIDWQNSSLDYIRERVITDYRETAAGRGDELSKQRARQASADANLKELQYHKEVRDLVPAREVDQLVAAWAVAGRGEIQNAWAKLIAAIESKHGIEVDRAECDDILRPALGAIGAYPQIHLAAGDEMVGTVATAEEDIDA